MTEFKVGDIVRPRTDIWYGGEWKVRTGEPSEENLIQDGREVMFADRRYRIGLIEGNGAINVSSPLPPVAQTVRPGRDNGHGSLNGEMLVLVERDGKSYEIEDKHRDRFELVLEGLD